MTDIFQDAENYDIESGTGYAEPETAPEVMYTPEQVNQWAKVNIAMNQDGSVNLSKSCMLIGRFLTRLGHAAPAAIKGTPFANSWWGPETFTTEDVENYFLKFDLEPSHEDVQKALSDLVRKNRISATFRREDGQNVRVRNTFQANSTML